MFAASSTLYLSKDGRPLCAFSHLKDDVARSNRFPVITPGAGNRGGALSEYDPVAKHF